MIDNRDIKLLKPTILAVVFFGIISSINAGGFEGTVILDDRDNNTTKYDIKPVIENNSANLKQDSLTIEDELNSVIKSNEMLIKELENLTTTKNTPKNNNFNVGDSGLSSYRDSELNDTNKVDKSSNINFNQKIINSNQGKIHLKSEITFTARDESLSDILTRILPKDWNVVVDDDILEKKLITVISESTTIEQLINEITKSLNAKSLFYKKLKLLVVKPNDKHKTYNTPN